MSTGSSARGGKAAAAAGVEVRASATGGAAEILTPEALAFVATLQREFNPTREALLQRRAERQSALNAGGLPDFLSDTRQIREGRWTVAPVPRDLQDRKVEITGPVDRKMVINALNSGASTYMADFEDANSPTWANNVGGHVNLRDAIRRSIEYTTPDGRTYRLNNTTATLLVRPRGWHLDEKHVLVDGRPISGSLMDFGLYMFHNARALLDRGTGPYFYLPKVQSHLEARLWNDVFVFAQDALGVPRGSIKATVLVEHILAAFEMEEILYELREHSAGLNAGRWDYIYSLIKTFRDRPEFVLPDRAQVTMTVPFMRAYTELLVKTCHRRGAYAIGGMAAFIPSRRDPEVNRVALEKVHDDKIREVTDGFDGTWVAHPDLVREAMASFNSVLEDRPHQLGRRREEVRTSARDLLDVRIPGGTVTEAGLRANISVGIQYVESWLRGTGAAALYNLMEDAATAEIARSQVWQWVRHAVRLSGGAPVTADLVRRLELEELARIRREIGADTFDRGRFEEARGLFEEVALSDTFVEFLTIPAYRHID
ncbi:MAG: malate synthase A [Bacillati bacterium ANGP1]|uniref:Malate synthase n=1 Tax=Candidatus Segetimicrobium genomatis TaxID=2569760 RepID=A0A537JX65_9BACT|nr:MAG: malate synthase A [Terrabacteria group bacterium ANGP1]